MRCEALTEASMKTTVFSLLELHGRSTGTHRLMMEAAGTSEMSADFHPTTRRNNPEDSGLRLVINLTTPLQLQRLTYVS
jgi:hypothetical protein